MNGQLNPVAWLAWLTAAVIVIASTRNPLYLTIAGLSAWSVHLSLPLGSSSASMLAWKTVLRIGLVVAVMTICFNLLTVHAGDRVLYELPSALPIIGGPATLNALTYGTTSAGAILVLMLVATTFNYVDRAALLRLVPAPMSSVGTAAVVGVSFFPQMIHTLREVREAQIARGFRVRSVRDIPPLLLPVLQLGLERAFSLAEAMESRGYGAGQGGSRLPAAALLLGMTLTVLGIGLTSVNAVLPGVLLAATGTAAIVLSFVRAGRRQGGTYRPNEWDMGARLVLACSLFSATGVGVTLFLWPDHLAWSPYPRLFWPPFSLVPGIACLLLVAPSLVMGRRR